MPRTSYIGQIVDGRLKLSAPRRKQMDTDIAKMKEGRLVEVEIRPLPRRSDQQNRYYWSVVVAEIMSALQQLGHEVNLELTHEFLKSKFNARPLCNADGELIGEIAETTTRMNKLEFMGYMERVKIWAAEYLGLNIPDPNTQREIDFMIAESIPEGVLISKI